MVIQLEDGYYIKGVYHEGNYERFILNEKDITILNRDQVDALEKHSMPISNTSDMKYWQPVVLLHEQPIIPYNTDRLVDYVDKHKPIYDDDLSIPIIAIVVVVIIIVLAIFLL